RPGPGGPLGIVGTSSVTAVAVVAFLVWLGVQDARVREARSQLRQAHHQEEKLRQDGAPAEEVQQATREYQWAGEDLKWLYAERDLRQDSWHARPLREVRRRTGW